MAMPRGSGKSSICECACIWSVLYGHREFVCLIGSDEGHAMDMLESIKTELDGNELLLQDFPEVVYPIQRLDGIANRCSGQLYRGQRTHIAWTAKEIVLPSLEGSLASGAIIKAAGITGRIRGMKYKRADGRTVRPSLVVLDDPQTDESARSLSQCATRESILAGAVLSDANQLAFAADQGRTLYTFNARDFARLPKDILQAGGFHSGIIVIPEQRYSVGEKIRRVAAFVHASTAESLKNRIEYL